MDVKLVSVRSTHKLQSSELHQKESFMNSNFLDLISCFSFDTTGIAKLTASRHKRIRIVPGLIAAVDQIVNNERLGESRRSCLPGHNYLAKRKGPR